MIPTRTSIFFRFISPAFRWRLLAAMIALMVVGCSQNDGDEEKEGKVANEKEGEEEMVHRAPDPEAYEFYPEQYRIFSESGGTHAEIGTTPGKWQILLPGVEWSARMDAGRMVWTGSNGESLVVSRQEGAEWSASMGEKVWHLSAMQPECLIHLGTEGKEWCVELLGDGGMSVTDGTDEVVGQMSFRENGQRCYVRTKSETYIVAVDVPDPMWALLAVENEPMVVRMAFFVAVTSGLL